MAVEPTDLWPGADVVQKQFRHAWQTAKRSLHQASESSANSLFIFRNVCCKSSIWAGFSGKSGRRGNPESNPSIDMPPFKPAMPYFAVTAAAAGAMIR